MPAFSFQISAFRFQLFRSSGAGEQGEEVASSAGQYEQMPDEMGVAHPFVDEK
jgi:hypothetical protein